MSAFVTPELIVVQLSLLLCACLCVSEWAYRQWVVSPLERAMFTTELLGAVFAAGVITFGIWYVFGFHLGLIGLALGIAWVMAFLFPLGALAFYLALLLIRPWELLPNEDLLLLLPKAFAFTVLLSWIVNKFLKRDDSLFCNASFICYILFLVWLACSGFLLGRIDTTLDMMMTLFFPTTVIFFMFLQLPLYRRDVKFLQLYLIIGVCTAMLIAMTQTYVEAANFGVVFRRLGFDNGLFGNSNDLGSLIVVALPLVFYSFCLNAKNGIDRVLAFSVVLFLIFCLWLTQSRGSLLAMFCMGLSWVCISSQNMTKTKRRIASIAFLAIPIVLSLFILRADGDLEGSSASRLNYIIAGFRMAKASPMLGVGLERYPELYESFTPAFHEWGLRTAHCSWILVLAEAGIPGLLIFCSLYIFCFIEAYSIRKEYPEYLLASVGYAVCMTLLSHSYLFLPYLVVGCIGASARVLRRGVMEIERTKRNVNDPGYAAGVYGGAQSV